MLSQKRAKDRATMAQRVRELAESHGFTADIAPGILDKSEVRVTINAARGLKCSMSFQPEAERVGRGWGFLGHWHTATDSDARLNRMFGVAVGGNINPHHQHKATTYGGNDFDHFLALLDEGLALAAAGEAWDLDREAWERANAHKPWNERTGADYQAHLREQECAMRAARAA